jgi:hypothetical protein
MTSKRHFLSAAPILNEMPYTESPPTFFRTNKFTSAFQALINAYGVATYRQCSRSESTCFWASRIRIYLSEVWIRIRIRLQILLSSWKNSKKNLDSYYFVTFFDFLSLEIM